MIRYECDKSSVKKTLQNPFIKGFQNAAFLSGGTLISQVIGFVGFLFIARLLGPEKYGIYATVFAFVSFFHLFVLNGLSKIVVREGSRSESDLPSILEKTIGLRLFLIGTASVLCVVSSFFTNYSPQVKVLIILFSTEVMYFGLDSFLGAIYQTKERMEYLSYYSVLTRILVAGFSILALYLGAGVGVILLVNVFFKGGVLCLNYFVSRKFARFRWNFKLHLDPSIMKPLLVFSLMGFINTFAVRIDILMISFLSTPTDVGLYSVAHEIGREGLMLRNVIAMAFFPIAVKYFAANKLKKHTLLLYGVGLAAVVFFGCVFIYYFGEDLVLLLFKQKYAASGSILKILVFYLPFTFFSLPFATCLQATHNESALLTVYSLTALTNIPLNIILFYRFGLIGIAYSTIIVFMVESLLILILFYTRFRKQGLLHP